jgi:alkaline phosphatase D
MSGTTRTGRSPIGRFRTPPAADALVPLRIGAVSCVSNTRAIGTLGHAGTREDLALFAFLGDTTYNDGAQTLSEYRTEWRSNLDRPEYRALRASTSALATWDDHEFDNDFNPESMPPAQSAAAVRAFFDHQPLRRDAASPDRVWKSVRWGRTAEIFVLDCRNERRPSTRMTPTAEYVSRDQMAWLKTALVDSTATFKLILNSVPISDFPGLFDVQQQDRWEGYAAQRTEILSHIDDQGITGVLWVAGDFHLASAQRVATSGPGASQIEVLVGPGAQSGNPLAIGLGGAQFDFATGTNNYSVLDLDPTTGSITIRWIDASGATIQMQSYTVA